MKYLILLFLPLVAHAYTEIPDSYAIRAGMGDTSMYSSSTVTAGSFVTGREYVIANVGTTNFMAIGASANTVGVKFTATGAGSGTGTATTPNVYYFSASGSDSNPGTLASPKLTYSAANTIFNSLPAGGAILFKRGDVFNTTAYPRWANQNATAESPVTIADYMPSTYGNRVPPTLMFGDKTSGGGLNFQDSGAAFSEEGVTIKNLKLVCATPGVGFLYGIFLYNDIDYLTVDNVKIEGCGVGFYGAQYNSSLGGELKRATQTLSDVVFTHNASGGDTIYSPTGNFSGLNSGDGVLVANSASNNHLFKFSDFTMKPKYFRVKSATTNLITLEPDELNVLVNESGTPNVQITLYASDLMSSHITVQNSIITNNVAQGILYEGYEATFDNNDIINNGWGHGSLDHNVYFAGEGYYITFSNNRLIDNNAFRNNANQACSSTVLNAHGGVKKHFVIDGNTIDQSKDKSLEGCWGISVDTGNNTVYEQNEDVVITNNTIKNSGGNAIGCASCIGATITGNTIVNDRTSGPLVGVSVVVRNKSNIADPDTSNVVISNNKIYGLGAGALALGSKAIKITGDAPGTAAGTSGTLTVTGNTISDFYECVSDASLAGSWAGGKTISGNTITRCTLGH